MVYELHDFVHRLCCIFDTCNSILLNSLQTIHYLHVLLDTDVYLLKFICTFRLLLILCCTTTSILSEI